MKKLLIYSSLAILLSSCGYPYLKEITKHLPPLEDDAEVTVYELGDTVPEHSEVLGGIVFSNNSDWDSMLEIAKKEARAAGGNGLEVQLHVSRYPHQDHRKAHLLSAFILNINDSIEPTQATTFEKIDFQDYVVINEGDTIPCSIVFESKSHLQFVYGHERNGNRKAMSLPKQDLLSYHIEDPKALDELNRYRRKTFIHKKLFTAQIAIDGGPSISNSDGLFVIAGKTRFLTNHKFTIGARFNYYTSFNYYSGDGEYFIAGSIGLFGLPLSGKVLTTKAFYNSALNGGYTERKVKEKDRFFLDLLFGYYSTNIGEWSNGWGEHGNIIEPGIGIGLACSYDHLITKHLSIGIELTGIKSFAFNKEIHRKHNIERTTLRIDFTAGLRYYF